MLRSPQNDYILVNNVFSVIQVYVKRNKYWSSDWGDLFDVCYVIICQIACRKAVITESDKDFFYNIEM